MNTCSIQEEELWSLAEATNSEPGDAALRQHVDQCPACRDRIEHYHRLQDKLASFGRVLTPTVPKQIGPYRILRLIGEGGMGVVYEAQQEEPERRVALKVVRLPASGSRRRLRAFQKEIRALSRLRHGSIATIHDAGFTEDGQHYFVMELVDGRPIVEYCDRQALALRDRLALFARVAQAVNYAHQRGVIHRDLKPANILVDGQGDPHIVDFGLVHFTDPDPEGTQTISVGSSPVGTLPYMSPEQARGDLDDVDIRTDVCSLGVLLYELMTGRYPYDVTGGMADVLHRITDTEPISPARVNGKIPDEVTTIILKALARIIHADC